MHIATAQMIGVALLGGINQVTSYNMLGGSGYQYVLHQYEILMPAFVTRNIVMPASVTGNVRI